MTISPSQTEGSSAAVLPATASFPILQNVLDDLMNRIDQIFQNEINNFTNAVLRAEYEAGREVQMAIQNAKEAYLDSMNQTMDRVDQEITKTVDSLNNMVTAIEKDNQQFLNEMADKVQQLINSLPFSSKQPQLTSIHPQYTAIKQNDTNFLMKFSGVFPWSSDQTKYPVTLKIQGNNCTLEQNTTQQLVFKVPVTAIPNQDMNKCTYAHGKLSVLWDSGLIFSNKETANYTTIVGALPLSPGKITAYYSSGSLQRKTQSYTSPIYSFNGNDYYPTRWKVIERTIPPQNGWELDKSVPPTIHKEPRDHGRYQIEILNYDQNGVQVRVGLRCDEGKNIGIVAFCVTFSEYQDVPVSNTRAEDISLKWGDSKMLQPQTGESIFKIAFQCFDGSKNEFGPADIGNRYLKLVNENGTIRLIAQVPDQL